MSNRPFRFVHAGDFHLEMPPLGLAEVPDHLTDLFLESPYLAAERVFDTVLAEEADFLILSGDLLIPRLTGPRGPLFLVEQFDRLAQREIPIYWSGGRVDPPEAWPTAFDLPANVHVFPRGRVGEIVYERDGERLARLIGISRERRRSIRASDFDPDPGGLFSIGVVHGSAEARVLQARRIDYWAMGGLHQRSTLFNSPHLAHYPGSPQGRRPQEDGPHSCTLVRVDPHGQARTSLVSTDVLRWISERVVVEEATDRAMLESLLRERLHTLTETMQQVDFLISWTVAGDGPLLAQLRHGTLRAGLLEILRSEFGHGSPLAWSLTLESEPSAALPPQWYDQESIRGEFLREIRRYQIDSAEPLELASYLSEGHLAGTLATAATDVSRSVRERVLREAAMLGVDLLSGEETQS